MTDRPPLTANGIEILARLRAGQSPAHIARVGWNRSSWSPADIAAVARDWSHRDDDGVAGNHGGGRRAKPIVHGTAAGWYQHRNRREQACKPCHEARKAAQREAWRRKKEAS